jgi:hypothetical protein
MTCPWYLWTRIGEEEGGRRMKVQEGMGESRGGPTDVHDRVETRFRLPND